MGATMRTLVRKTAVLSTLLVPSMATNAADQSMPPSSAIPRFFNWTGFYIGGNVGTSLGNGNFSDTLSGLNLSNSNNWSFIGGGQVGGNYQFSNFVVGFEGDFDWTANNNNSTNTLRIPSLGTIQVTSNNDIWITTLAGRLGIAWDRALFYGKAGGAFIGNSNFTVTNQRTRIAIEGSSNNRDTGWLVGGGVEWAFTPNCIGKVEYDLLELSSLTRGVPTGSPFLSNDTFTINNRNVQMVTVGISYLLNWGSY